MRRIHIGHHFYGAGNVGDDLMLAGFLTAVAKSGSQRPEDQGLTSATSDKLELSCCTPFDREALSLRFPEVTWLPYDTQERRKAIADCDLWLGLGGSPWQNAVSRWFIDHLEQERSWCRELDKPMRFLGVGGQDAKAYQLPETRSLCQQADGIWTRDAATAEALSHVVSGSQVHQGSDLAHVWLSMNPPPAAKPGRLVCVLNFDYSDWPGMNPALQSLNALPVRERVWLAQESRALPGAEIELHALLSEQDRKIWLVHRVERPSVLQATHEWPCGEWQLGSRFHATIVAAWAGSRSVVLTTNEKLRGVSAELGYPALSPDADMSGLVKLMSESQPPSSAKLQALASLARQACMEATS